MQSLLSMIALSFIVSSQLHDARCSTLLYLDESPLQEARNKGDDNLTKRIIGEYDRAIDRYIPALMQQAKIYWDMSNYSQVEKIFRKSVEFCHEREPWKLNVAHVLFMQENKYKEAIQFYEQIVKCHLDNILSVNAVVLANLCVSYIMNSQNEEAEELMRKIEKDEDDLAYGEPEKKQYHLCIVNLVIGTLYCAKGNYEFGIGRILKSLEPYSRKLGTDTWYYAKRCFLSLLEQMAKHTQLIRDSVIDDCLHFLEECELHGRFIKAREIDPFDDSPVHEGRNTVAFEARLIRSILLKLQSFQ